MYLHIQHDLHKAMELFGMVQSVEKDKLARSCRYDRRHGGGFDGLDSLLHRFTDHLAAGQGLDLAAGRLLLVTREDPPEHVAGAHQAEQGGRVRIRRLAAQHHAAQVLLDPEPGRSVLGRVSLVRHHPQETLLFFAQHTPVNQAGGQALFELFDISLKVLTQ